MDRQRRSPRTRQRTVVVFWAVHGVALGAGDARLGVVLDDHLYAGEARTLHHAGEGRRQR